MTFNKGSRITSGGRNTISDLIDDWFSDGCNSCSFGDGNQKFGWGGSLIAKGYYDLTAVYQQIFTQIGTGAYTYNEIIINARRSASGNYIEIQIICNDDHAGTVDGTTTATYQYKKLSNQSSGVASLTITAPSVAIQETFE